MAKPFLFLANPILLAEGQMAAAEIEKRYPNWQEANRQVEVTVGQAAEAARLAISPIGAALEQLANSRSLLADSIRRSSDLGVVIGDIARPQVFERPLTLRDPDEATRQVAHEVRGLAQITEGLLESNRANAAIMDASLVAVQSLHETTRLGIAAGEKRENVLVRLTVALVALTIVLVIPELRGWWHDAEGLRGTVQTWLADAFRAR